MPDRIFMLRGEAETQPINIGYRSFSSVISTCLSHVRDAVVNEITRGTLNSRRW